MIYVKVNGKKLDINMFTFSGDKEEYVNILSELKDISSTALCDIFARLDSSSEIMKLLLVTDALKQFGLRNITLWMPYIPYARQDRVCKLGDAFSIKVFAKLINDQNYTQVIVADAHSTVSTALIENVKHMEQHYIAEMIATLGDHYDYIIAPDAGASKKAVECTNIFNKRGWNCELVQSLKVRDKMGIIVKTDVLHDNFEGKSCLIVDDICAGGATFTALAEILKQKNAGTIGLYVTHGIFSKGVQVLFDNYINEVYTTDSFEQLDTRVHVVTKFFN